MTKQNTISPHQCDE